MQTVKDTVYVQIQYYTGHEDPDDIGQPYYVAYSDALGFTTQGDTFEELLVNIRECVELSLLDSPDSIKEFGVLRDAKVKLVMDMPEYA
jgi:predicted RNase H-like HicB family nuclease